MCPDRGPTRGRVSFAKRSELSGGGTASMPVKDKGEGVPFFGTHKTGVVLSTRLVPFPHHRSRTRDEIIGLSGRSQMFPSRIVALGFAFTLLISGNASAHEDWPMYGRNLLHTFSNT